MNKLNIGFLKTGKSILFRKEKWDMYGGAHETTQLISTFAQMNPNINIYLFGLSDWEYLEKEIQDKININKNIINIWKDYSKYKDTIHIQDWPLHYCKVNNIKIDFIYSVTGPTGEISTTGKIYRKKDTKIAKALEMFIRYMAPLTIFLNEHKTPYIELAEDQRYLTTTARDLYHRSIKILSTRDIPEGIKVKHVKGYLEDSHTFIETTIPIEYGNFSTMFMMAEPDKRLKEPGKRNNLLSVYSNGLIGLRGMNKFPYIKDYVLDNFEESTVYGIWDGYDIAQYEGRIIPKAMSELIDQMLDTKYAFMIPIRKGGWTTSKFYKHLICGIIPFFHEFSFTTYYRDIPEFLLLKSPEDFKEKINFLENNPDEYLKLWNQCQALLRDEYFDGTYYNEILLNEIGNIYPEQIAQCKKEVKPKVYNMSCIFPKEPIINNKKSIELF